MLRRLAAAVAGIVLAGAGLGAAPLTAAAADSGQALCGFNGAGTVAPPVNYQEHAVTYQFTGTLSCVSSDSSLNSGKVTALGAGSIGCFRGDHSAVLQVAWPCCTTKTSPYAWRWSLMPEPGGRSTRISEMPVAPFRYPSISPDSSSSSETIA